MNNEHTPLLHSYGHRPRSWLRGKQHFVLSIVVIALIIFSFGYYETRQYDTTAPSALLHHFRNKNNTHTIVPSLTNTTTTGNSTTTGNTTTIGNHTVIIPPLLRKKSKIHNVTKTIDSKNLINHTTPSIDKNIHHEIPDHIAKLTPKTSVHTNNNNNVFKFTNEIPPFSQAPHPIQPILTNTNAPYPTNSWFSSLFVRDSHGMHPGEASITTTPYTLKSKFDGLSISYAGNARRDVNMKRIREQFHEDLIFSTEYPAINKSVISYDALMVTIRFFNFNNSNVTIPGSMTSILTRGSPYITVEYNHTAPVIRTKGKFIKINNSTINATSPMENITDTRFEVNIETSALQGKSVTQTWILYSSKPITFSLKSNYKNAESILYSKQNDFQGIVRAAVVPENEINGNDSYNENINILDSYKDIIPVAVDINYELAEGKVKTVFDWKVKSLDDTVVDDGTAAQLLMVALPHQADCLSQALPIKADVLRYRTVKGYTSGVLGSQWVLLQNATDVSFESSTPIRPEYKKWVRNALKIEWNSTLPTKLDPYFAGKEFARRARFAVIASALNETEISSNTIDLLKSEIEPWMNFTNPDPFIYEPVWGGICSKNGIKGLFYMTDFGNGWYSDHHFHYGYFLYALAVIGRHDPNFLIEHQSVVSALIRDIANPDSKSQWYTMTRYFSWYDGHSFASGVFVLDEGKSQESISEAINAWYSIALIGQVMNNNELLTLGHVLLSWEIKGAEYYWQMKSDSKIYEDPFAQNKMVGQVAATRINYKTWFGNLTEDMHIINVLPFTPITDAYISKDFVKEEYPVLEKYGLQRNEPKMLDSWRGYSYMVHAIIDQEKAWKELRTVQPQWYDDGNSHTNALYWVATHPEEVK